MSLAEDKTRQGGPFVDDGPRRGTCRPASNPNPEHHLLSHPPTQSSHFFPSRLSSRLRYLNPSILRPDLCGIYPGVYVVEVFLFRWHTDQLTISLVGLERLGSRIFLRNLQLSRTPIGK